MSEKVSRNQIEAMMDLAAMRDEPLDHELVDWVEESDTFGTMLRHPLVYALPLAIPGMANRQLRTKRKALAEAEADEAWHTCVFLHERPYRLRALIDYATGRDEEFQIIPLSQTPEHWDLAADVWVDSENIAQVNADWQALFQNGDGLWLGTEEERAAFDALPDPIPAWRGGTVGDWSWTTQYSIAEFFSNRSDYPVRHAMIPKADVFGYFTRRNEYELLVRLTEAREPLVYPDRFPGTA